MNEKIANDLIRYAELVEDAALISPEEMNCASLMRLAAEALAQPEQERVAWLVYAKGSRRYFTLTFDVEKVPEIYKGGEAVPLYTTPPQRKPLTGEKAQEILQSERCWFSNRMALIITRAIEAAHGIKE